MDNFTDVFGIVEGELINIYQLGAFFFFLSLLKNSGCRLFLQQLLNSRKLTALGVFCFFKTAHM